MASIGALNLRMHAKVMDDSLFRIKKRAGVGGAVVAGPGLDVGTASTPVWRMTFAPSGRAIFPTDAFVQRLGLRLDGVSLSDTALGEGMMDAMIDEALVFTVDGEVFEPGSGKSVAQLGHPVLLTLPLHPPNETDNDHASNRFCQSERLQPRHSVVGWYPHCIHKYSRTSLPPPTSRTTRKELAMLAVVRVIQSTMSDVSILIDTLEENPEGFGREWRPFGAQQTMVFRDQLSWTEHTTTEKIF
ncbi:hypothetical protein FRC11_013143, partial [Ceratobasidium sp. 423]